MRLPEARGREIKVEDIDGISSSFAVDHHLCTLLFLPYSIYKPWLLLLSLFGFFFFFFFFNRTEDFIVHDSKGGPAMFLKTQRILHVTI